MIKGNRKVRARRRREGRERGGGRGRERQRRGNKINRYYKTSRLQT